MLIAVLALFSTLAMAAPIPVADVPIISVDTARSGYSLVGQWQFQPGDNKHWAAADFNDGDWASTAIPQRWPAEGFPETGQMAWYRLTVQFDLRSPSQRADLSQLGIRLGKVMSAYELYAGGQLVGGVGKLPPLSEIDYGRRRVLEIPASAISDSGKLVLALRVWGGSDLAVSHFGGGPFEGEIEIGDYSYLLQSGIVGQMPGLLMSVLFIGFGLYHLYLHRRNRQLDYFFWFGLLAINVGVYTLMLNQWRYLLDWSFLTYAKIEYGSIYLLPAIAMQLLFSAMGQPFNRLFRIYQAGFVLAALTVVLVPGLEIHFKSLSHWQLYTLPLVFYCPWLIIRQARAGHAEARTALIGVIIFVATCLNDLSMDLAGVETIRLLPYGFVAVMLSMAVSLANRFTAVLTNLENEVSERTEQLQSANLQLAAAATHDPLTGLLNRRGFTDAAEIEVQRALRSGREFTIILADIDNFKLFNDRHGHACGDLVLQQVAEMLSRRVREADCLGRWGGEEFIFMLPETSADGAWLVAENLRESIAANVFELTNEPASVSLTFGIAAHRQGETLDNCIARADTALYQGKDQGRNRVMIGSYPGLTLVG